MKSIFRLACLFIAITLLACNNSSQKSKQEEKSSAANDGLSAEEARQIAREAYTYAFPLVDIYRITHAYFVAKDNTDYKGNWNMIHNISRVYTPADKAIQTPNSDTPYSWLGLDLRTEPMVLTIPKIEKSRYFSVQLVDAYTHNFAYIGTRETGNDGGAYLIAGPGWKGELPKGITKIIQSETELVIALYRTQLFNPGDIEKVKNIQSQYKVQPLSEFLGTTAPQAKTAINFVQPLTREAQRNSLEVFSVLNFILQFCPTHPSETALMDRFAKIGIGAGKAFDSTAFPPEIQQALRDGIADSWKDFAGLSQRAATGDLTSADVFGTREFLKNNYGYRMTGAVLGILGNSKYEAIYPAYIVDDKSQPLNGANKYIMRFAPGQLPPVNAFWSLTMYELPASLLVENPINRYLINSPMVPNMKKDKDGGYTFYIQHDTPGKDREANWLPAPSGPFTVFMRLYLPKEDAFNGKWTRPPITIVP